MDAYSWWFTVPSSQDKGASPQYDHFLNRLEKERGNAARMGLQLVVQCAPLSVHYSLHTTPSIDGPRVSLYNEQGVVVVPRQALFWNGDYLWYYGPG
jgi:hypothetical protein